jgi:glycosyltransferase involved in cell wall biosynthesis
VPPGDPAALAGALLELLALAPHARAALGREARERVRRNYDLAAVAARWVRLYTEVASRRGGRA